MTSTSPPTPGFPIHDWCPWVRKFTNNAPRVKCKKTHFYTDVEKLPFFHDRKTNSVPYVWNMRLEHQREKNMTSMAKVTSFNKLSDIAEIATEINGLPFDAPPHT